MPTLSAGRSSLDHLTLRERDADRRDVDRRRSLESRIDADNEPEPPARIGGDRQRRRAAIELLELVPRHRAVRVRRCDVAEWRRVAAANELGAVVEVRAVVLRG